MLMLIAEYGLCLAANEQRTRLLNGRVRGTVAGYTQKLTVTCQWASLAEIEAAVEEYFPGTRGRNMEDVTGVFFLDGEPSLEPVVTPDHYLKNATLTGSAWFATTTGRSADIIAIRGKLQAP